MPNVNDLPVSRRQTNYAYVWAETFPTRRWSIPRYSTYLPRQQFKTGTFKWPTQNSGPLLWNAYEM